MDKETLDLCMQNVMHYVQKIYKGSSLFQRFIETKNRFIIGEVDGTEAFYSPIIACANIMLYGKGKNSNFNLDPVGSLDSIFNLLFHNETHLQYGEVYSSKILYPSIHKNFDLEQWRGVQEKLLDGLENLSADENGLNRMFDLCEETLSYIPCSNNMESDNCISLSDAIKFSTCLCANIYQYLIQNSRTNLKQELTDNQSSFLNENSLLLFSCNTSGIQKFIYTVSGKGALKSLRSRSFYLEMLLEHVLNSILRKLSLPVSSIVYAGGGHAYMLLPNTQCTIEVLENAMRSVNDWLLHHFDISLYMTYGYTECSANNLFNISQQTDVSDYQNIFIQLSVKLSENRLSRYHAQQIKQLNAQIDSQQGRECRICSRSDRNLDNDDVCITCKDFIAISPLLLNETLSIVILQHDLGSSAQCLKLPSVHNSTDYMYFLSPNEIAKLDSKDIIQIYHRGYEGLGRKIAIGSYAYQVDGDIATFEELSNASIGIDRIAVLRADVDNLGIAFMRGFDSAEKDGYNPLLLTAALSKQLTLFFKQYIGDILSGSLNGVDKFNLSNGQPETKKVVVVYSGGDDMFIVGAWNDVIETAVDLNHCFEKFTANSLTFSAGIGLFETKYPLYAMAQETEQLENFAKSIDKNKNAIALFGTNITRDESGKYHTIAAHNYKWSIFTEKVVGEKLRLLQRYFKKADQLKSANGNAFLYRLKSYIEETEKNPTERINIARFAYLLARLSPTKQNRDIQELYSEFSTKMYVWILNSTDRKQLLTAITIFVYLTRGVND